MMMSKGRVTIPTDDNFIKETMEIAEKWGADGIRDCDGFKLPKEIKGLAERIYSTYFVARGDNKWAEANKEELQQTYLMTKHHVATEDKLVIKIMDGYFEQQVQPDIYHDIKVWWEVIDRTSNEVIDASLWKLIKISLIMKGTICPFIMELFHKVMDGFFQNKIVIQLSLVETTIRK